ncbi:MAG TPA: O-antigen ligase family protein [Puia sp.]|nr:O-antigen ligase family protein [Puia sp.]
MAQRQITGRRPSRLQRAVNRIFVQNKLYNWVGVLVGLLIAGSMGYLLAQYTVLGLGVFGLAVALAIILTCLFSPTTGFYVNMVYCLFIYQAGRMLGRDDLPVGTVIDVLGITILFGYFIKGISLKERFNEFARSPVVILIIINFLWGAMEIFNPEGHSIVAWGQAVRRAIETFVFLYVIYLILEDKRHVRRYIRTFFVVMVIVAAYGCLQEAVGLFGFERAWVEADQIRFGLTFINGQFRKFSTFNDPAAFGAMMAAVSVFFIVLAMNERKKRTKRVLFAGSIVMIAGMLFSGTRTANVMLIAGLGMYVLLTINRVSTRVFALGAAFLLIGILYAPIYSNYSLNRFRSSFIGTHDESYNVRVMARNFIRPYMLSHPFGGGLATTNNIGLTLNPGHPLAGFQTDSGYLQLALEIGWVGLGLICILFYMILKKGVQCYFRGRDDDMRTVYAAGVCAIFSYYVGMFAQNTLGHLEDMTFYYPLIAIFLRFKYYENPDLPPAAAGG